MTEILPPGENGEIEILQEGLKRAGEIVLGYWRHAPPVRQEKTRHSTVTEADLASERFLIDWIKKHFPHDDILSEESPHEVGPRFWTIDPIDGTSSFQRGLEEWSIALARVNNGKVDIGMIYAPAKKELFYAKDKQEAFLNGKKISVSNADNLRYSLIYIGYDALRADEKGTVWNMVRKTGRLWTIGSTSLALAYLAAGRIDVVIQKAQPAWDFSAGLVLVREAGGKFTTWKDQEQFDFSSSKNNDILATNDLLHPQVLPYLTD